MNSRIELVRNGRVIAVMSLARAQEGVKTGEFQWLNSSQVIKASQRQGERAVTRQPESPDQPLYADARLRSER